MQASDIMSVNACSAGPDTPINEIARKLCDRNISAMPIVDRDGKVLGIVSEGDLLRRIELGTVKKPRWTDIFAGDAALARDYVKSHGRAAKDVMTHPAIVVEEDADIAEIANLLESHRIKRVPVVRDGRLVGIVSRSDIVRGLIVAAKTWSRSRRVDEKKIRAEILDEIHRLPFAHGTFVNVVVEQGEVHLWGNVESDEQRAAIRVIAENTRGVTQVVDNLADWRLHGYA
jgi:CBS domain-containing protein